MPIYEYRCLKCKSDFEAMQKFSDAPVSSCPKCGSAVKKKVSSTSFQLKGSGWYMTDYAKKGSSGASKESPETTSAPSANDAKPAASTESE